MSRVYGRAFEQSKEMRKVSDCKGRRIKPEMVRLFNEGKTYKEISEIVGLGSEYIKKIINSKDRKISNTKSQRARPIIIEMLNELEAIKDIAAPASTRLFQNDSTLAFSTTTSNPSSPV